jgi:hypothetical protein
MLANGSSLNNSPDRASSSRESSFDEAGFGLAGPIDLAVDAVEVADLVRVEIDADRDATAAATQYRVDEAIRLVMAAMLLVERVDLHRTLGGARRGHVPTDRIKLP